MFYMKRCIILNIQFLNTDHQYAYNKPGGPGNIKNKVPFVTVFKILNKVI